MVTSPARRPTTRSDVRMVPGTVEVDGRIVHYAVSDNEEHGVHPQVWALNVHGYFAGGGMYWRESARIAAGLGWRVVNPSLPGFGGSEPLPWDQLSMDGFARTLDGLLEALGAGPVVILGHSMGGAVAMRYAHDYPQRTLGVVYRDGAATVSWKERQGILAKVLSPISPDLGAMADLVSAVAVDVPDFLIGRIRSTLRGVMPDARRNLRSVADVLPVAAMLFGCDLTRETAHVVHGHQIPTFPVWGRFDRITPRNTAEEFSRVTGLPITWVRGGHSWMIARPGTQRSLLLTDQTGRAFVRAVHDRARAARSTGLDAPSVFSMPTGIAGGMPSAGR